MDVNGTRFHLLKGKADWLACREPGQTEGWGRADWYPKTETVALKSQLSLFPRGQRDTPLKPADRRGAAADRYGNWYWISHDRKSVLWMPYQAEEPQPYWDQSRPACQNLSDDFRPVIEEQPILVELAGLAITAYNYLVVGNVTQRGILVFDLHAGGAPTPLLFPADAPFKPFDMAAPGDGSVWILDRKNRTYWGLDRHFQLISRTGFSIKDAQDPISIEALPDGSVLILDTPTLPTSPSTLYYCRRGEQRSQPLPSLSAVAQDHATRPLIGHDMAYAPDDDVLYVVERDGNQTIALTLNPQASPPFSIEPRPDYLPMHYFGSRALVAGEDGLFYDVVGTTPADDVATRWVELLAIDKPRYTRTAQLLTPILDGKERSCVWHRLCLDAHIPPTTTVQVWTRAHNDRESLASLSFTQEPVLYRRGVGAEMPYHDPFPELDCLPEGTGTWELLFQEARGRFLQIRLELQGDGRSTPRLQTLRAYYPRFSYTQHYLPAVYRQDEESASFLERLLANMEGFYTEIEGKISDVDTLFDARSAPPETLDWLASWFGLMMDPLWSRIQERRRQQREDGQKEKRPIDDRRRLFIRYARKLYDRRGTPDGIRFALHLLLNPYLETTLRRLKAAAVNSDDTMHAQLNRFGLPHPTATTSELALEDLLYELILAQPARVRIVEHFLTRGAQSKSSAGTGAHSFSVLVPAGLSAEEEAMVKRIVNLEKPAHTRSEVNYYWEGFRVGEARLGIDTTLDRESRFEATILGRHHLAESYLYPAHPADVKDRLISGRDRLGSMPPL